MRAVRTVAPLAGGAGFPDNYVRNTRSTPWTLLPLSVARQFRRFANCYFLAVVAINQIPALEVFSPYASAFPLVFVLLASAGKDAVEEYRVYVSDRAANGRLATRHDGSRVRWRDVRVGDVLTVRRDEPVPADGLLLDSSAEADGAAVFVDTSALDGESALKARYPAVSRAVARDLARSVTVHIEERAPSLYQLDGEVRPANGDPGAPVSMANVLLRGCVMRVGAEELSLLVTHTGHDVCAQRAVQPAPAKRSRTERRIDRHVAALVLTLAAQCGVGAAGAAAFLGRQQERDAPFVDPDESAAWTFLSLALVFQVMVPLALYVCVEIVKLAQSYRIQRLLPGAHCNSLSIPESLGQVQAVLSDKTGTLTTNQLAVDFVVALDDPAPIPAAALGRAAERRPAVAALLRAMALCNEVDALHKPDGSVQYESLSPDELAFVRPAAAAGVRLWWRTPGRVTLRTGDEEEQDEVYDLVLSYGFTAERKRSSVVVRCPDGSLRLLVKGSDSTVLARAALRRDPDGCAALGVQLEAAARRGLRVLLWAERPLSERELEEHLRLHHEPALASLAERHERLAAAADRLEGDGLTVVGFTATADVLQPNVPDAVARLRAADVRLWMITGDRRETAATIALRAGFFAEGDAVCEYPAAPGDAPVRPGAAVLLGGQHPILLGDVEVDEAFWEAVEQAPCVICYHVAPSQKLRLATIVKARGLTTLAIGDGANDVPMVRGADVGVGVVSGEGAMAARAADYVLQDFQQLAELLLVHGHLCDARVTQLVAYTLAKNVSFVFVLFWFVLLSGFSGQTAIDEWNLIFFNMLYTALPPIVAAVYDCAYPAARLRREPALYRAGSAPYSDRLWALWMLEALWQSFCCALVPVGAYWGVEGGSLWVLGTPMMSACVLVANGTLLLAAGLRCGRALALALAGSTALYPLFTALLYPDVFGHALADARYWLSLLLAVVAALAPRVVWMGAWGSVAVPVQACGSVAVPVQACGSVAVPVQACGSVAVPVQACAAVVPGPDVERPAALEVARSARPGGRR